jgi:hypothetical protein
MEDKLDQILADTTRIKAALWPDEGQPGVLTRHGERMDEIEDKVQSLEGWRNYLIGAWSAITLIFGTIFGVHVSRHGG